MLDARGQAGCEPNASHCFTLNGQNRRKLRDAARTCTELGESSRREFAWKHAKRREITRNRTQTAWSYSNPSNIVWIDVHLAQNWSKPRKIVRMEEKLRKFQQTRVKPRNKARSCTNSRETVSHCVWFGAKPRETTRSAQTRAKLSKTQWNRAKRETRSFVFTIIVYRVNQQFPLKYRYSSNVRINYLIFCQEPWKIIW